MAVVGPRTPSMGRREYTSADLRTVQNYEDNTNEAIMVLEANADVLTSVRQFYERLVENKDFPLKGTSSGDVATFTTRLNDMIYDLRMQISRAKLLVRITADRKSLVIFRLKTKDFLSNRIQVLQHLQSQATEKMEILTMSMNKEAIAMRIITVVTLIYLPATFVSVSFGSFVTVVTVAEFPKDLLRYRCYQIPKSEL